MRVLFTKVKNNIHNMINNMIVYYVKYLLPTTYYTRLYEGIITLTCNETQTHLM